MPHNHLSAKAIPQYTLLGLLHKKKSAMLNLMYRLSNCISVSDVARVTVAMEKTRQEIASIRALAQRGE